MRALDYWQSDPSCRKNAAKLAMREKCNLSVQHPKPSDQSVGAIGNLAGCFTPGATITKDIPIRPVFADVGRAASFVIAIIPLCQIRFDFNTLSRCNQSARSLGSLTRATEDVGELGAPQSFPELPGLLFAMLGQRNICSASVLVGQ